MPRQNRHFLANLRVRI